MLSSPVMQQMVARMVQEESAAMRQSLVEEQLKLEAAKKALEEEKSNAAKKTKAKKEPAVRPLLFSLVPSSTTTISVPLSFCIRMRAHAPLRQLITQSPRCESNISCK
jgi:hypothetical protein